MHISSIQSIFQTKFFLFWNSNSIITAYVKIHLWMVSLSTIGRLIYTQILKFQMAQNETHHFKYAIWIITKNGKESPLNILCFNILSFFWASNSRESLPHNYSTSRISNVYWKQGIWNLLVKLLGITKNHICRKTS